MSLPIQTVRKLGIKVIIKKDICYVHGKGMNGYNLKRGITINARNSEYTWKINSWITS